MTLPRSFYLGDDVIAIARDLIGKVLVTNINGHYTSAMITETEAYEGVGDKASHAYGNRRTQRTEMMYTRGGVCYIYLCYGIHHLFNVVTNETDIPHAVLIRAAAPIDGVDIMLTRRKMTKVQPRLTAGPGILSAAMGITTTHNGLSLNGPKIFIEDRSICIPSYDIITGTRVGVAYAKEDALLPYRFCLANTQYISKGTGL